MAGVAIPVLGDTCVRSHSSTININLGYPISKSFATENSLGFSLLKVLSNEPHDVICDGAIPISIQER